MRAQLLPPLPEPQLDAEWRLLPLSRVPAAVSARRDAAKLGPGQDDGKEAAPAPGPSASEPVQPPPGTAAALLRGRPAACVLGLQGVPGAPGPRHGSHRRGLSELPGETS